jgi:hypothetical protein
MTRLARVALAVACVAGLAFATTLYHTDRQLYDAIDGALFVLFAVAGIAWLCLRR